MSGIFGDRRSAEYEFLGIPEQELQSWRRWAYQLLYPSLQTEIADGTIQHEDAVLRNKLHHEFRDAYENHVTSMRSELHGLRSEATLLSNRIVEGDRAIFEMREIHQTLATLGDASPDRQLEQLNEIRARVLSMTPEEIAKRALAAETPRPFPVFDPEASDFFRGPIPKNLEEQFDLAEQQVFGGDPPSVSRSMFDEILPFLFEAFVTLPGRDLAAAKEAAEHLLASCGKPALVEAMGSLPVTELQALLSDPKQKILLPEDGKEFVIQVWREVRSLLVVMGP